MSDRANFIASPLALRMLDLFGVLVYDALDPVGVFMVGSALTRRDWRDVDVRAILFDDDFAGRFGGEADWRRNRSLGAHNLAFSALGKQVTGLPIDFQIEQMTVANAENPDGGRHALGHALVIAENAARAGEQIVEADDEQSCPGCGGIAVHLPHCQRPAEALDA